MCIIAICNKRKLTDDEIMSCFESNDDGAGMAWHSDGINHYSKGYSDPFLFAEAYKIIKVLPHVVHFRIGTSGGLDLAMTHPFVVSTQSPIKYEWSGKDGLLFHNGIILDWKKLMVEILPELIRRRIKLPPGQWSDSRAAAFLCAILGEGMLSFMDGKFVYVAPNGDITRTGSFQEEKGVLFSNYTYKRTVSLATALTSSPAGLLPSGYGKYRGGIGKQGLWEDDNDYPLA
jgi:hypothetical protein